MQTYYTSYRSGSPQSSLSQPSGYSTQESGCIYDRELHPKEIRLMKLLPGQWHDKICCDLDTVFLTDEFPYNALSYVWGSQKNMRPIYFGKTMKLVTVNLERILRRLRKTDSPLTLWVDAICTYSGRSGIKASRNQQPFI